MFITGNRFPAFLSRYQYPLLLLLILPPLFFDLGGLSIRLWDESRLVANTIEMYHNHNYMVTHFDGAPDLWNTKPPLMIWIHLLMVKTFGFNEWSFRVSSALFAALTCIYLYVFTKRQTQSTGIAFLAVFVLITTRGFVDLHVSRTGDYDALLIYLSVLALGSLYRYLEEDKTSSLYYFALFLGLAVLTKGPMVLLFGPAILVYILYRKKLFKLLSSGHTYAAILLFSVIALPYYFIREQYNPGYLQAVYDNELGGRFLTVLEERGGAWHYYLEGMTGRNFMLWFLFIPVGIYYLFKERNTATKDYISFCSIIGIMYFIMISSAKTKHGWYDAPAYPFFAVLVAYTIITLLKWANQSGIPRWKTVSINIFFCLLFVTACSLIWIENLLHPNHEKGISRYDIAYYIKAQKSIPDDTIYVWEYGYMPTSYLYFEQIRQKGGAVFMVDRNSLPVNKPIWIQNDSLFRTLQADTNLQLEVSADSFYNLKTVKLRPKQ